MTEPVDPIDIALTVVRALDALGITSTIGGSIASSFAGEPRSTIAIAIVAAIDERHAGALVGSRALVSIETTCTRQRRPST